MAVTITLPADARKATLIKGDYSLRYWDEMTRPGTPVAQLKAPPGGTVLTVTGTAPAPQTVSVTLAPGERSALWFLDASDVVKSVKFVVGGKRYETSASPGWTDPDPGSIRARPSTYAPPGTGTGQAAAN